MRHLLSQTLQKKSIFSRQMQQLFKPKLKNLSFQQKIRKIHITKKDSMAVSRL